MATKTYSFSMQFTNIDAGNTQVMITGDCIYDQGKGIQVYDMVSNQANKLKNTEVVDIEQIMDTLSSIYATTGRIVNISFTFKP
jgi:hypothetical protein